MDEGEAIAELQCLSDNAKRWLEDRVGNRLQYLVGGISLGTPVMMDKAIDGLIKDMNRFGCFERQARKIERRHNAEKNKRKTGKRIFIDLGRDRSSDRTAHRDGTARDT
jgi:hypothetical protein